ncbi:hypothetical protein [Phaeocystidibacter luteus]|uniref:Trimeric autotransporter adhesin YadA-like head domain-containing protein n=1 Tax=Phaeocystidibacter luteus TaxID=911197 RepID=A0A6N6RLW3_9FLAO|nr:hypothetical protein [Phaeocystidibacter luteus]KAB2814557.1 hypothetical protein F8C67_02120 [Phaeocystidibacter luteus]
MTTAELLQKIFIGYKKTYTDPREFWDVLKELASGTGNGSLVVVSDIASMQGYGVGTDQNANTLIVGNFDATGGVFYYTTDVLVPDGENIYEATGRGSGYWVRAVRSGTGNLLTKEPITTDAKGVYDSEDSLSALALATDHIGVSGPIASWVEDGSFNASYDTSLFSSLLALGFLSNATGQSANNIGHFGNALGDNSFTFGSSSRATGQYGFAFQQADVTGNNSTGFQSSDVTGEYAFGIGRTALAHVDGSVGYGYGLAASDANVNKPTVGRCMLIYNTPDATPIPLSEGVGLSPLILRDNSVWEFQIHVGAVQVGTSNMAKWNLRGCVKRDVGAATVAIVGVTDKDVLFNNLSTADVNLVADVVRGCLNVEATGLAATSIRWTAEIVWSETLKV